MTHNRFVSLLSGCALAVAALFAAQDSRAAGWADNVTILELTVDANGTAYFKTSVTLETAAACAASGGGVMGQGAGTNRMSLAFNSSTPEGKNLLSLVTSAYLSGKVIKAIGTGACMSTTAGSIEVLNSFRVR